jgi:hypothetical protein
MQTLVHEGIEKIKSKGRRLTAGAGLLVTSAVFALTGSVAMAAPPAFSLNPFTFVGAAGDCGPGYPAGSNIVTSKWDSSTGNPAPSILLQKNGPTSDCSAAGVDIVTSLEGQPVSNLTELNFDYKTGEHCGAGAPRFNIQTEGGTAVTLGCTSGTQTDLGNGWTHVEFNAAQIAAAAATTGGITLQDLYIIFDEGTDTPAGGTVGTPGTVHIDNISVNNQVVGSPTSPVTKDDCKNGGWKNLTGANGQPFKNQGDCVSYVATHGKNLPAGAVL